MKIALTLLLSLAVTTSAFAADGSITDFGALPDGTTLNTLSIQKAIDHIAETGGGTLTIPAGTFLTGAIFLKPHVNLHLDKDAVLKGTTNIADYPAMRTRIEGHFEDHFPPALLNADASDGLRISGEGTLDGSGQSFWDAFWTKIAADKKTKNLDVPRPRLVMIQNSHDVQISNIHLLNSGYWNLHIYKCDGVIIDGLDIKAGAHSPSTDGTDIDSSSNVTIKNCTYFVNDDCIALKGSKGPLAMDDKDSPPVEHITIENCTFVAGQGMVTLGSEATIVRDVTVQHCTVAGPGTKMPLVRLKLRPDTPQLYENIRFDDITLDGVGSLISVAPWKQYFDLQGHAPPTRAIHNVTISNIHGKFGSFGTIHGNAGDVIDHITFQNIDVQLTNPKPPAIIGVDDLVIKNVKINGNDYSGPEAPTTQPN
jgi:polygalacturonase